MDEAARSRSDVIGGMEALFERDVAGPMRDFADPSQEWRRLFSELLGTFFLVLVACGGGVMSEAFPNTISRTAAVTAPGLMVLAIILFMGKVSGAHLNPAVSVAFSLRGDFPWRRVPGYVVVQLIGAALAAWFVQSVVNASAVFGSNYPASGYTSTDAFLMEAVLTLGLVSVILGTASGAQNLGAFGALGVGGYIILAGLWGSPISGASMNPARTLDPPCGRQLHQLLGLRRGAPGRRCDRCRVRLRAARARRWPCRLGRGSGKPPDPRRTTRSSLALPGAGHTGPPRRRHQLWSAIEVVVGREGQVGSTVYGTVLVLAALTAAYAAERHQPKKLVELVVTAVFVFWSAYVYAHALSESIETATPLSRPGVAHIARRELGIMLAAVVPILALLLGVVGLVAEGTSVWLAIALGLITLTAEGYRYARVADLGAVGTVSILVANLLLGLSIVVMKVSLVH